MRYPLTSLHILCIALALLQCITCFKILGAYQISTSARHKSIFALNATKPTTVTNFLKFAEAAEENNFEPYHSNEQRSIRILQKMPDIRKNFLIGSLMHVIPIALLYQTKQKVLTQDGLIHAGILGVGLWTFLGYPGWLFCIAYLLLGTLVTKVKMSEKEKLGIAEKRGGARGPENIWGSAATGLLCAALSYLLPQYHTLFKLGYVASLATKLSDTFASELGKAFGRTTFLITTLQIVPKGTEGAVSVEGTVAGVFGSVLMVSIAVQLGLIKRLAVEGIVCVLAAFLATNVESYIGAVYQTDNEIYPWLPNEVVNGIMTMIGATIAMLIGSMMRSNHHYTSLSP